MIRVRGAMVTAAARSEQKAKIANTKADDFVVLLWADMFNARTPKFSVTSLCFKNLREIR